MYRQALLSMAKTFSQTLLRGAKVTRLTAGAVSIATISEKTAGTKMEISPLKYMIETSGFFHYTHICSSNIRERRSFKIFNRFVDM